MNDLSSEKLRNMYNYSVNCIFRVFKPRLPNLTRIRSIGFRVYNSYDNQSHAAHCMLVPMWGWPRATTCPLNQNVGKFAACDCLVGAKPP